MVLRNRKFIGAFAVVWLMSGGLAVAQFDSAQFDSGSDLSSGLESGSFGSADDGSSPAGEDDSKKPLEEQGDDEAWDSRDWDRVAKERERKEKDAKSKEEKPKKNRWKSDFHPVQLGSLPASMPTRPFGGGGWFGTSGPRGRGTAGSPTGITGGGFGGTRAGGGGRGSGGGRGGSSDAEMLSGGFSSPDGAPPGSEAYDPSMYDGGPSSDYFPLMPDPFQNMFGDMADPGGWNDLGYDIIDFDQLDMPKIPPLF